MAHRCVKPRYYNDSEWHLVQRRKPRHRLYKTPKAGGFRALFEYFELHDIPYDIQIDTLSSVANIPFSVAQKIIDRVRRKVLYVKWIEAYIKYIRQHIKDDSPA